MSPAPVPGNVRVWCCGNVGDLRAGRWNDVRTDDPMLAAWRAQGFVVDTDPAGDGPPADLPQRCCGG